MCRAESVLPHLSLQPSQVSAASFEDLPCNVLHDVLDKVELYDVTCVMCVCKKWRSMGLDYLKGLEKANAPPVS